MTKPVINSCPTSSVRGFHVFGLLVVAVVAYFKVRGLQIVPFIADEPDDLNILVSDLRTYTGLYEVLAVAPDQSRLPHLVSSPLAWLFRDSIDQAIVAIRLLFFIFHLAYLFVSYRLVMLLSGNSIAAWIYVLLLTTSAYLSAFSIFSMTTSDSLFLLFHLISLYLFCRMWIEWQHTGVLRGYLYLGIAAGVALASKLFASFLLLALFLFHALYRDRGWRVKTVGLPVQHLLGSGLLFLSGLAVVNLVPYSLAGKTVSATVLTTAYVFLISYVSFSPRKHVEPGQEVSFFVFWLAIGVTSICTMLVFSPIYLNFDNLLAILDWPEKWNKGAVVADARWYDSIVIIGIKFGLVSLAVLLVPLSVYLTQAREANNRCYAVLFGLIILVHLLVISIVKHKVTWYPLAIFPILYLPFAWMWSRAVRERSIPIVLAAVVAILVVVGDNLYRYTKWYPYAHFDGAQYGDRFIGWNKPALVTFEVLPLLDRFLSKLNIKESYTVHVNTQLVSVPHYNAWITDLLSNRYQSRYPNIRFGSTGNIVGDGYDLLLTSPLYNRGLERVLYDKRQIPLVSLELKGIAMMSIWDHSM